MVRKADGMIDVFVERNDTATWGRVPKAGGMTLEKGEGVEGWADTAAADVIY